MKKIIPIAFLVLACAGCTLVGAGIAKTDLPSLYDFGPLHTPADTKAATSLPPLGVAEVNTPAWLDSPMMYYRLSYANVQQPRPYAGSRWVMPPGQLFGQRLKARIAQAGGVVLGATDGAANVPVLHIDADEFAQSFDSPTQSKATLSLRASLFNGRSLVAQKTFTQQAPAPSADAAGGARALSAAADAAIADMMNWLAALSAGKEASAISNAGPGKTR